MMMVKMKSFFNKPKSKSNLIYVSKKNIKINQYNNQRKEIIKLRNKYALKTIHNYDIIKNSLMFYTLEKDFSYADIVRNPISNAITYTVIEPELDEADVINLANLKDLVVKELKIQSKNIESRMLAETYLRKKINELYERHSFEVSRRKKEVYIYYLIRDNIGFGKIESLMHDPMIEDISCDGDNINIYVWHRIYESISTNLKYESSEELDSLVHRLAYLCNKHLSVAQPMLDASLPDGSRINITYGKEITRRGSTFTIRKFKSDPLTIIDLINYKTITTQMAAYLWFIIENRLSLLVSGGIASGKTTLLNCISMFISPDKKIVSIEDTPELKLPHENWIQSVTRTNTGLTNESSNITLFDLLQASLRQRPEFIIVGEIRGKEAYTLFQAIGTGHLGMATIHGDSVDSVIYRLESEPMNIPRALISGIDCITVQRRVIRDGVPSRRTFVTSELVGIDPKSREILTNEVYRWNALDDTYSYSGRSYLIERICEKTGLTQKEAIEEIDRKKRLLQWMVERNIRSYQQVSDIIRKYNNNKELFGGEEP
jgi:flagellar protein FlaI